MKDHVCIFDQSCLDVNKKISTKFELLTDKDFNEKTHLFNDRYENLYLDTNKITELNVVVAAAKKNAAEILETTEKKLKSGFWLNAMMPGDITTAHTHDDDDELLSCVYYIKVPENSGGLMLMIDNKEIVIKPIEGQFVFFSPKILHQVYENKSKAMRLSIAFNFGLIS